jgi:O-6-methylguanine DNA methyltransferase
MVFETRFGWVGLAWSDRGLMAVSLPQPTKAEAWGRLPAGSDESPAEPSGLDVADLVADLQRYFDGVPVEFDVLLDPSLGTDFQRQVWDITRAIPRGETRTYGELARLVGSPRAARAIGQAMACNPWPVIVPCHRVVGHDGRLTGFGGGLVMKERMLVMEGALREH